MRRKFNREKAYVQGWAQLFCANGFKAPQGMKPGIGSPQASREAIAIADGSLAYKERGYLRLISCCCGCQRGAIPCDIGPGHLVVIRCSPLHVSGGGGSRGTEVADGLAPLQGGSGGQRGRGFHGVHRVKGGGERARCRGS